MSRVNDGVAQSPYPSLKAFHDEVGVTGGDSWDEFYNTYRFGYDPSDLELGDRMARFWDSPANSIYARAVFALDARRTPGVPAAGNTTMDLSSNAMRVQNGTTGNAKIVQDGAGGKALLTPGTTGSYALTPDAAALDITGDIDIRCHVALDDWTPSASAYLVAKRAGGGQDSYEFFVNTNGTLRIQWYDSGTSGFRSASSTVAPTVSDGAALWVRATLDADNGASGNTATFYTSADGSSWTQLGSPVVTATAAAIAASTAILTIGAYAAGTAGVAQGRFFQAQVYSGIDGTLVADFNPTRDASFTSLSWTSATTGETWTVTPGGSDNSDVLFLPAPSTYGVSRYVHLPGIAGNYLSAPDEAALDITGDIDLRVTFSAASMSATTSLFSKGVDEAYSLFLTSTGSLRFNGKVVSVFNNDSTSTLSTSTLYTARVTRNSSTGQVVFYLWDGSAWVQFGSPVAGTAGALTTTATALEIGTRGGGGALAFNGNVMAVQIWDGIEGSGGTKVFDWSAEDTVTATHSAFTASTGQTVTVNRATSGRKTAVVEAAKWLLGTDDYLEIPDNALLDLDAATDFTVLAVVRQHATPTSFGRYVTKYDVSAASAGWGLMTNGTNLNLYASVDDGPDVAQRSGLSTITAGQLSTIGIRVLRSDGFATFTGGTLSASASMASVGDCSNTKPVSIGRNDGGTNYQDFELYAVYIWREALSASELAAIAADWSAA